MKTIEYFVKDEDIRNSKAAEAVVKKLFLGKDPKEHVFIVDYKDVKDPVVTMSTGIIFQNFATAGFIKTIIKNHRYKEKLLENPTIKLLIGNQKLEVK